jgi:site-specific recombinase XerD
MTPDGVRKVIQRAGEEAKLGFPVHPHMLRHPCGYKLANDGHDTRAIQHYLGHKNIQHMDPLHRACADTLHSSGIVRGRPGFSSLCSPAIPRSR